MTGDGPDRPDYRVQSLTSPELWQQAAELYRSVFGYQHPSYGINPRLLASFARNGGSVVGAVDRDGSLVAFAFGFLGSDGTRTYHYSQAAVVAPGLQSRGLGRQLKLAQRELALKAGSDAMRWSYDPLLTRNGHFNLDVLNATGVSFHPDMYGDDGSDRIMIEWDLTQDPAVRAQPEPLPALTESDWATVINDTDDHGRLVLAVPSDITTLRAAEPERADRIGAAVRDRLSDLFDRGYQAVSCQAVGETAGYIFRPSTSSGRGAGSSGRGAGSSQRSGVDHG